MKTASEPNNFGEHKRIALPELDDIQFSFDYIAPQVKVSGFEVDWYHITLPSYQADKYLKDPRILTDDFKEALAVQNKLKSDPGFKAWWQTKPEAYRVFVHKGLGMPMTYAPWDWLDRTNVYLTVVQSDLRNERAANATHCTHYIKLSEHERILREAREEIGVRLESIVTHHVERGVETGVARAVNAEAATLKQVKVEKQQIEAQKAELERQLAKLNKAEERIKEREKAKEVHKRKPVDPSGYVYLVSIPSGPYKIGRAVVTKTRVKAFDTDYPEEPTLVHKIFCHIYAVAEKELHDRYADKRIRRTEWFNLTPEDVAEIKAIEEM